MSERPDDVTRQLADARRLIASKSYTEAEQMLLHIVAARPGDARAWHELGNARYRSKAYAKAVEAFRRRYGIEPDNPIANYSLGVALVEVGRVDEARMYLKRVLDINPDFHQAQQRLDRLGLAPETRGTPPESQGMDMSQRPSDVRSDLSSPSGGAPGFLSQDLQHGRTDPGKLLFSGHQLLRIYWGRFMIGAVSMVFGWLAVSMVFGWRVASNGIIRRSDAAFYFSWLAVVLIGLLIISAVVSARSNRYRIYERRIDFNRGILSRSADSVWFFEVTNVTYQQPLSLLLAGSAEIAVQTEKTQLTYITGIAGAHTMKLMWEEMRDSILAQRRDLKGIWV